MAQEQQQPVEETPPVDLTKLDEALDTLDNQLEDLEEIITTQS